MLDIRCHANIAQLAPRTFILEVLGESLEVYSLDRLAELGVIFIDGVWGLNIRELDAVESQNCRLRLDHSLEGNRVIVIIVLAPHGNTIESDRVLVLHRHHTELILFEAALFKLAECRPI